MAPADLVRSARRSGANRWTELRLFEILGGWVPTTAEPEVKLMLDRHSFHHAWRAQQWWDRLPVVADIDREELVAPASDRARQVVEELAGLEGTRARLAGAYRVVLPRLAAAYRRQEANTSPLSDGSTLRTLAIVAPDLAADWREGEFALHQLLTSPEDAAAAARAAVQLESALVPDLTL